MAKITNSMILEALNEIDNRFDSVSSKIDVLEKKSDKAFIKELQNKSKKLLECSELIEYLCDSFESTLNECVFSDNEQKKIESAKEIITWASSIEKAITSLRISYNELLDKEERLTESMTIRQIEFGNFVVFNYNGILIGYYL